MLLTLIMNKRAKKNLLHFLYFLVYCKKALVLTFKVASKLLNTLLKILNRNIGFRIYKFSFNKEKTSNKIRLPWHQQILKTIGQRNISQIIILIVILIIILPQSKLYSQDNITIPGQKTLLYKLVGPNEEDYALEDVTANWSVTTTTPNWKEGAIVTPSNLPTANANEETNIGSLVLGGTAVCKPTIAPGASLDSVIINENEQAQNEIIQYQVKAGETISTIAKKFKISVETILWANNLTARSPIHIGDTLKIPPISGVIYTVKKGDTLGRISITYKCNASAIISFNSLSNNGASLKIGQEIMIPNGTKPVIPKNVLPPPKNLVTTKNNTTNQPEKQATAQPTIETEGGQNFIWPVKIRRITQYFSFRHTALDIGIPIGTPVYATKAGTVIKSQCGWNGGYGCYIIIDHGNGFQSLYGHNSVLLVNAGDEVEQGQNISFSGTTGRSTGPHLHFEIRINGKHVNPLSYIK